MRKLALLGFLLVEAAAAQTVFTLFDVKAVGTPATADLTFVIGADTIRGGYGPTGRFMELKAVNQTSCAGAGNFGYIAQRRSLTEGVIANVRGPDPADRAALRRAAGPGARPGPR